MSGPPDSQEREQPHRADSWDGWAKTGLDESDTRLPLFLGRDIYRRRRVMDAARLLPALGTILLMLPILWAADRGTAAGGVYVFIVWLALIIAAAFLSHRLSEPLRDGSEDDTPGHEDG